MKKKICYFLKFVFAAAVINLVVACTNSQGEEISWSEWLFQSSEDGGGGYAGAFLTTVGQVLGGPWGYALAGVGAATGPVYKWFHHDKSATGLIQVTQEARAALDPEARKVFDDTAREAMNNAKKGNLRSYVRDKKNKLRRSGKMILERFSDKHSVEKTAKKIVKDILNE